MLTDGQENSLRAGDIESSKPFGIASYQQPLRFEKSGCAEWMGQPIH